ncbi:hypothetical protein [Rathayibacter sp. VKM Ac-2760]|uniref:hypothetical protein n=1 Tax=Rathayibacter sp. VKM Ac-2760 TaxID=2609253 RepID=UPI0013178E6D|nr:hypothetical protein [Rathayibacter sp. VKM Ac-2760]QHC57734.1 hypothetical protein GSU72_03445 [Rathayibacter sp. VKM Ac-2760]
MTGNESDDAAPADVRGRGDRAAAFARAAAPLRLAEAEELYAGYLEALADSDAYARGATRSETRDLVERSIRAEFAVAEGLPEQTVSRRLENAQLLFEHLPLTRALLAQARLHWEEGEAVCGDRGKPPRVLPRRSR